MFSRSDVDFEKVKARTIPEFEKIKNGTMRNSRTNEQIFENCIQGQYAEQFLMDNCQYTGYPEDYHDLLSSSGVITEVKTSQIPEKLDKQFLREW